jgi:uncharacterized protein with LGFP repeats
LNTEENPSSNNASNKNISPPLAAESSNNNKVQSFNTSQLISTSSSQQSSNAINPTAIDAIKSKYQQFAHTLGNPSTDIQVTGGGKAYFQKFENGWILWLQSLGAHEVYGAIADKWDEFGRDNGILGFPISDEHSVTGGSQSDFQHGSLYWIADKNEVTVILRR